MLSWGSMSQFQDINVYCPTIEASVAYQLVMTKKCHGTFSAAPQFLDQSRKKYLLVRFKIALLLPLATLYWKLSLKWDPEENWSWRQKFWNLEVWEKLTQALGARQGQEGSTGVEERTSFSRALVNSGATLATLPALYRRRRRYGHLCTWDNCTLSSFFATIRALYQGRMDHMFAIIGRTVVEGKCTSKNKNMNCDDSNILSTDKAEISNNQTPHYWIVKVCPLATPCHQALFSICICHCW